MTERERMRSGRLYQAGDRELSLARDRAKELCYDYNALRPSDRAGQAALLRRLLGKVGRNPCVLAPFWCDYGEKTSPSEMSSLPTTASPSWTAPR